MFKADYNDAVDNLYGALMVAGHFQIPEVCLYFNHKLFRGNRTTKFSSDGFDAFASMNYPPLVEVGINFSVYWNRVRPAPNKMKGFRVRTEMSQNIAVLKLYPGMTTTLLKNILAPPLEGCVIESYGTGNFPCKPEYLATLKEAIDRGVVIVNITQCPQGVAAPIGVIGKQLSDIGVIWGRDMTTEAALSKLGYLLSRNLSSEKLKTNLTKNMRGELTPENQSSSSTYSMNDTILVDAFVKSLKDDDDKLIQNDIISDLMPSLLCSAAGQGNLKQLQELLIENVSVNIQDYDGRSPLHLAASEGHYDTVVYLIDRKADINAKDKRNQTPLDDAIINNHPKVVQLLEQLNAEKSITLSPQLQTKILSSSFKPLKPQSTVSTPTISQKETKLETKSTTSSTITTPSNLTPSPEDDPNLSLRQKLHFLVSKFNQDNADAIVDLLNTQFSVTYLTELIQKKNESRLEKHVSEAIALLEITSKFKKRA
eukprot:TRINITY_DN4816_c0_g1_i2.p1 TRINITY_DN4816_c0_g1~~TRINITY_DN4816_c0_g1_i2.p1  ORF type:complete len:483 (-),score=102.82 TRINITY_DN4816_c0_g1_i2:129-1577(-)